MSFRVPEGALYCHGLSAVEFHRHSMAFLERINTANLPCQLAVGPAPDAFRFQPLPANSLPSPRDSRDADM